MQYFGMKRFSRERRTETLIRFARKLPEPLLLHDSTSALTRVRTTEAVTKFGECCHIHLAAPVFRPCLTFNCCLLEYLDVDDEARQNAVRQWLGRKVSSF